MTMNKRKRNKQNKDLCKFNRVRLIVECDEQAGYHLECVKYLCRAFHFHLEVIDMELLKGWGYPQYTIEIVYLADNGFLTSHYAEIIKMAMFEFKLILEFSIIEEHPFDYYD